MFDDMSTNNVKPSTQEKSSECRERERERAKFLNIFQKVNEPVIEYVLHLKQAPKYCEFEKLESETSQSKRI